LWEPTTLQGSETVTSIGATGSDQGSSMLDPSIRPNVMEDRRHANVYSLCAAIATINSIPVILVWGGEGEMN